ncbi:MAG: hypothetical protein CHACPFDD_00486 [Phycisphaerae bacterium]|nr:hypothetical protein [Phycisphaerae bacterium]
MTRPANPSAQPRGGKLRALPPCLAVAAAALLVRAAYLQQARPIVFFDHLISDGRTYFAWARTIAGGDWLGHGVFYQAPLYPYVLAVFQLLVGEDLWAIRLIQAALGAAACALVCLAATRWISPRAGWTAGAIMALYPPAIFFDGLIQKSVLDLFWLSLLLWRLSSAASRSTAANWAIIGVAWGLLTLTRENAVILAPLLITAALLCPSTPLAFARATNARRLLSAGALAAGAALVLLPVSLRNKLVGGEFALTTSQAGTNFYIGNNPRAFGSYAPLRPGRSDTPNERQDATELAEAALGHKLTPSQVSRYWWGQAWSFIRAQPAKWLALTWRKTLWTLNSYEIPDAENIDYYAEHCSILRWLRYPLHFGTLLPLAVAGAALTWPRRRELWLLYALPALVALSVILFYVFARYRYPMTPMLAILAAAALTEAPAAIRQRRFRRVGVAAALLILAAILANWPIEFPKRSQVGLSYANAGAVLAVDDDNERAIREFQTALTIEPRILEAHLGLGKALARAGRFDEALAALNHALKLSPSAAQVHVAIASTLLDRDDVPGARRHADAALRLWPDRAEALAIVGCVQFRAGQFHEAFRNIDRAARLEPNESAYTLEHAWALATCADDAIRNPPTALTLAKQAAALASPRDPRARDVLAAALAANGRFAEAQTTARAALDVARTRRLSVLADQIESRLRQYEAGKPVRHPTSAPATSVP